LGFELKNKDVGGYNLFSEISSKHFQLFNIIFGLFLIIGTIVINTELFIIGPLVFWITFLYGIILIVKAISHNFSNQDGDTSDYDKNYKTFRFKREFKTKFKYVTHYNVNSVSLIKCFRKLELLDMALMGWMLILTIAYQVESWIILNNSTFLFNNLSSTAFLVIEILFVIFYVCLPIDQIEIRTPHYINRIEITTKIEGKNIFTKFIGNLKKFPKEILKTELKKSFILRLSTIIFLILISFISTYIILATNLL
jgi:hypothetical protein